MERKDFLGTLCGIILRGRTFFGPAGLLDFPFRLPCRILDQKLVRDQCRMQLTMLVLKGFGKGRE